MRCFLKIQYNGANYHGWQYQPNAITVQEKIEQALFFVLKEKIPVVGCGRTDTGVHAYEYYLHFDISNDEKLRIINDNSQDFIYKLNGILNDDIKVCSVFKPIKPETHARFSALKRTYKYKIITQKDPFLKDFAYRYQAPLDLNIMNEACKVMMQYNDFGCFCKAGSDNTSNICNIIDAHWTKENHVITFTITADRFLRNMVRAICGTMIDIGTKKITIDDFKTVIEGQKRSDAGMSVPAKGLCLYSIDYGDEIFKEL